MGQSPSLQDGRGTTITIHSLPFLELEKILPTNSGALCTVQTLVLCGEILLTAHSASMWSGGDSCGLFMASYSVQFQLSSIYTCYLRIRHATTTCVPLDMDQEITLVKMQYEAVNNKLFIIFRKCIPKVARAVPFCRTVTPVSHQVLFMVGCCNMINSESSACSKLEMCIGNISCQLQVKYYILNVFAFECNLSVKL